MKQLTIGKAILLGGSMAGALDILFALSFAGYNGMAPMRLLQTVASGALGNAAFTGGMSTAALGLGLHFALSFLWAGLFCLVARRAPLLVRRPLVAGIGFGIVVFLTMRLIVLPLSSFPFPVSFKPLGTTLDLLSHMLLFGLPIALFASKALARGPDQ